MSLSVIHDIEDPALLCWHKVKGVFYPCCVKKNKFPGMEKLKFTPTKQHAIVYIGFHVPWVGTCAAVSVKDLYPYNYEGPQKCYKQTEENNSNLEKRWSPEMIKTYLSQMIRKKLIKPSKVAHERIKLNGMLRQVIYRYEKRPSSSKLPATRKIASHAEGSSQTKGPKIVDLTTGDNSSDDEADPLSSNVRTSVPHLTPTSPSHSSDPSAMVISTTDSCEESVFSDLLSISEQSMTALRATTPTSKARLPSDQARIRDKNELLKQIFRGHR